MAKYDRDLDQSTSLFLTDQSGTLPVPSPGVPGMSGDPDKTHATVEKAGARLPEAGHSVLASQSPAPKQQVHFRQLSPAEWARLARGVGAPQDDGEHHTIVHPTCWYWPPNGLPQGLYRDTVTEKTKNLYQYHILSILRWVLMISQIIIGAILTALSSLSNSSGTPITVLAAVNTVNAGLLALMHNTGIPERYRYNCVEFSKVEDAIMASSPSTIERLLANSLAILQEVLDTGVIEWNKSVDEVLSDLFDKFHCAKASVNANMPSSYVPQEPQRQKPPFYSGGQTPEGSASSVVASAPQ